ncbi:DUF126 domain-containing protein [Arthrobacter sp. GMC3]|uniref:aconitase X swivel domain-containing protein n=1 Tax=Arthrobacter sp. GMC3 TaxID=2058894 RepID=UPI000CE4747C|nr:DUF126 domain-containing protein [Arthrobacter sp. GMC3]
MSDNGAECTISGTTLCAGEASGQLLVLAEPLSFWGGTDRKTGLIIDTHHPQHGASLAGRVLLMDASRGSSSSSSVLAEQIRAGVGPAAILLTARDVILALGALAAAELYGTHMPIVLLDSAGAALLRREDTPKRNSSSVLKIASLHVSVQAGGDGNAVVAFPAHVAPGPADPVTKRGTP